jgi:hypothetical protein
VLGSFTLYRFLLPKVQAVPGSAAAYNQQPLYSLPPQQQYPPHQNPYPAPGYHQPPPPPTPQYPPQRYPQQE